MKNPMLICVLLLVVSLSAKPIYNLRKSYVTHLTNLNFKDQIVKIRQNTNQVSVVHFYKDSDGKSKDMVQDIDQWTNQYNGVFRVGAVDCQELSKLCADEEITVFPSVKVYPPVPMPAFILTEELTSANIQKKASKYLHSNVIEITSSNVKTFLQENPSVPKVLLFTQKKGVPMVYKGLSVAFEKKLTFGIVKSSDEALVHQYGVKTFPSVVIIKMGDKKPHMYKGKDFNFRELFEFLNIYSEVFVPGGGSSLDSSATKQWMTEVFPEIHAKSAKDICLGVDGTLCVILLTNQKPSKEITVQFEELTHKYARKIERGANFKFMWLNAQIEQGWGKLFNYSGKNIVVVLNPGKRKRFTLHEGEIEKMSLSQTLDAISGGDARFNRITELPQLEIRTE